MKNQTFATTLFLGIFSIGIMPIPTVQAQDMPPPSYASGDSLVLVGCDRNFDLVTSQGELTTCVNDMFALADKDRSGILSTFEFEDWRKVFIGSEDHPPFRLEFDRNMDGKVTKEEFEGHWLVRFNRLNKDTNAALTRAELYRPMPRPNFSTMPRRGGPPGGMPPGGPPGGGGGRPPF
jgi:EF hand